MRTPAHPASQALRRRFPPCASFLAGALLLLIPAFAPATSAASLLLWDTGSGLLGDKPETWNRQAWKAVPSDLLELEANPVKARSDPGYYGREYAFSGDAVVENAHLIAVFHAATATTTLFAKDTPTAPTPNPGHRFAACTPIGKSGPVPPVRLQLLRHAADEVIIGLTPTASDHPDTAVTSFSFGRSEIVEIRTPDSLQGLRISSPIEYGIIPGYVTDDLVFPARGAEDNSVVHLPSENVFVGLLEGGSHALMATWPQGRQQVRLRNLTSLRTVDTAEARTRFDTFEIDTDGKSLCLAPMTAPGLWHRQTLLATHLETDLQLAWKPPFPARWKTQLTEADIRTTFNFHETRAEIWRGVPGSYIYPAWIQNGTAYLHPGKKIPPKGDAIIYFLEGNDTPAGIPTPYDMIRETLGRSFAGEIMDTSGRRLRTHHRRGGDGVHRACTCGCTEAIQAVFEAGQEVERKDYVQGALDDMIYFVARHVDRIGEYQRFADGLSRRLDALAAANPGLKEYLEGLKEISAQIPQECTVQKENMKSPQHTDDLAKRTLALTREKAPGNVAAYMLLLKEWREMGGSQDYVVAQCHVITRRIFQEAGYRAAANPQAALVAPEIRSLCRQTLRNPDGYEVWAEY